MLVNIPCFVLQLFGSLEEPLKEANANKNVTEDAGQSGVLGETYSFCLVDENCCIALHCTIQGMVQRSMGSVNKMWKCLYLEITYEFWKSKKCPWNRKFISLRIHSRKRSFMKRQPLQLWFFNLTKTTFTSLKSYFIYFGKKLIWSPACEKRTTSLNEEHCDTYRVGVHLY